MPKIIEQGKNHQLQQAAGIAAQGILRAQQEKIAAEERAFARERFEFTQEQAAISNDFRTEQAGIRNDFQQQSIDQRQKGIDLQSQSNEFNQGLAGDRFVLNQNADTRAQGASDRQDKIFSDTQKQEAAAREFYLNDLTEHGASPEELAVLGNADIGLLEQAAGMAARNKQLQEGSQRLEGLTQTVIQAMNLDPEQPIDQDDPMIVALTEGLNASVGTLEGQAAFRQTLINNLHTIEEQKADARERVEFTAQMQPMMEQFTANMPVAQQGLMSVSMMLYQSGEIEKGDLLDDWSKIVKSQESGSGGQSPGERYLGAFSSRRGTEDAINSYDRETKRELTTENMFRTAQQTARLLDTASIPPEQRAERIKSSGVRPESIEGIRNLVRGKMKKNPDGNRVSEIAQSVAAIISEDYSNSFKTPEERREIIAIITRQLAEEGGL